MRVDDLIGSALAALGVKTVFGVVGSGNFHFTNALVAGGARFIAARHEGGAASMADAYARMSGEVAVLSVHQGCGFTNALTGITEAAKSRTPLLVLAAEAPDARSNFFMDQPGVSTGVGAVSRRVTSAETALDDVRSAYELCINESRTVVLNVPINIQNLETDVATPLVLAPMDPAPVTAPETADIERLVELLLTAQRPVFIAGRGARSHRAKAAIVELARLSGALLATSAVAKGLFVDEPWNIDVSGGFSSPLTAELIGSADLIVSWGCALNMWTTRHGHIFASDAALVQVDRDRDALGRFREIALGVEGDTAATASATSVELSRRLRLDSIASLDGYRSDEVRDRIASELKWKQVAFTDESADGRIDPRTFSIELDRLLPAERVIGVDSGNFLGYPSMFLDVPDELGFCFTQAFQSVGLGLATAIGAAIAVPDRLPIAACGDGGFLMGISELDTVIRLGLPMVIVVYNDSMYGAEAHHFGTQSNLESVQFPETDIAAIAAGYGMPSITVREPSDLHALSDWLADPDHGPILIDAKVVTTSPSWWLHEAFGH